MLIKPVHWLRKETHYPQEPLKTKPLPTNVSDMTDIWNRPRKYVEWEKDVIYLASLALKAKHFRYNNFVSKFNFVFEQHFVYILDVSQIRSPSQTQYTHNHLMVLTDWHTHYWHAFDRHTDSMNGSTRYYDFYTHDVSRYFYTRRSFFLSF